MTAKMQPFWWFKAAYVPTERITNGGFETGDTTGWEVGGDYGYGYATQDWAHSGLYSCDIRCNIDLFDSWIRQTFTGVEQSKIVSFGLWICGMNWGHKAQVTIEYSDATSTVVEQETLINHEWSYMDLLPYVEAGKTVTGIKISHNGHMTDSLYVDDVSLIA
jgi:hypothetical protein